MNNYQWIIKSPFYVNIKKHHCPECSSLLKVVKVSRTVSAGSNQARMLDLDYSMVGGVFQSDKVTVIWKEFECPQCSCRITVDKMKEIEGYNT